MSRTTIRTITVEPLNIPLLEPFSVATGSTSDARNVLITIMLEDGSTGYGECAPFTPSTGETQGTALSAAQGCAELIKGRDAAHWRSLSRLIRGVYFSQGTAIAGIEMALLDALTRSYGIPLYVFFGGASTSVETDMSIPMVTPERGYDLAKETVARGISSIKIKKSGFVEALDIAAVCRARHTELMIGAMMESRLAIAAAAHFVAGLGGFRFVDLDTPMLLAEDPFTGGYEQSGGVYDVSGVKSGLGIERK